MYKYQFTSKVEDLFDAEDADMTRRTVRRWMRWAVSIIALAMVVTGIGECISQGDCRTALLRTLAGSIILYYLCIRSLISRYRIRKRNAPEQDLLLEFRDALIHIEVSGHGTFKREYSELLDAINAARGVLLYFNDGTVNWLPNRVFKDKAEKVALVKFLLNQGVNNNISAVE